MEITIGNNIYDYSFIGELLNRPRIDLFGITDNDLSDYNRYQNDLSKYYSKVESIVNKISFGLSTILAIVLYVVLFYDQNEITKLIDSRGWLVFIVYAIISILCFIIIFVIFGVCFFIPLFSGIFKFIISFLFRFLSKNKIINAEPTKPKSWEKVKKYQDEINKYKTNENHYSKMYPGIDEVDYDLCAYGKKCITYLVDSLINFTHYQNGQIHKENIRQEQKYWFDLDPYDFEKEVAYWFEKQGYKAKVTQKTGDGGIDIIISKDNYKAYVQCKRYKTSKVDRPTLNALYGVVCADKVNQGIVVCLLGITDEAKEFAKKVGIKVVTIDELAPKDDLFHQRIIKETLPVQPVQYNEEWCEIGNLKLNTICFSTLEDAKKQIENYNNAEFFHLIKFKGLFFCVNCDKVNYKQFSLWMNKYNTVDIPTRVYKKRKYHKYFLLK